jgi:4-diphosphocytidyl-2-C-methyl-D-erythritol kinase
LIEGEGIEREVTGRETRPTWPAPAKLNLFLHILGRRADGYHELQTCFQFIDLCDKIAIEPRSDGQIRRGAGAAGVAPEADLCVRAALALKAAAGCALGADISVHKRIPMGAGLGGGSSDAATCLLALNQLWGLHLPSQELAKIGLQLGADVPVFVSGQAAFGEGVGERLTPLYPPLAPPEANYLIIKPNVFVSTRDVFQDPELTRNSDAITIHGFLASGGRNDCLEVVRRRYPEVARAFDWLSSFGTAHLTGTGACVFMVCEPARARGLLTLLPAGWEGFLARGLNASPLLSRLTASGVGAV